MNTVTARLENDALERLSRLAEATRRSRSWLVAEAVYRYLQEEEWQIAAIEEGVKAADDGRFASPDEVKNTFAKWGVDAR